MSNRIRQLRLANGLTMKQVATNAGTSVQQIYKLEQGSRRLTDDWMRRIARALGVPISALLPDLPVDNRQLVQDPEEIKVLRWWREMGPEERRMIAIFARDKGVDLLNDHPKKRRA
jgi:transcriptional regulator with XRE-family HTH domain